ncbi:MAG: hypothetical protein APF78_12155 [Sphingomonadales bacterium BRH_c3]|nr:MAG: hypothetical protein APF78_12155 [Sphingomonadales bacterium BRH_c3]
MTRKITSLPAHIHARAEWASYLAFVKLPALPEQTAPFGFKSFKAVLRMLALDLGIMLVLVSVALLALMVGVDLPQTALSGFEIDLQLALMVVIAAPLAEEILFRGWLSGRPGHLLAFLVMLSGGTAVTLSFAARDQGQYLAVLVATAFLAFLAILLLRNRPALGWFRAIFPIIFWLSTFAFASIHLLNYEEGSLAILLPLVLPQFVLGTILAYLRVHYGLWSCVLLHAAHNGLILGVVALASSFGS